LLNHLVLDCFFSKVVSIWIRIIAFLFWCMLLITFHRMFLIFQHYLVWWFLNAICVNNTSIIWATIASWLFSARRCYTWVLISHLWSKLYLFRTNLKLLRLWWMIYLSLSGLTLRISSLMSLSGSNSLWCLWRSFCILHCLICLNKFLIVFSLIS